SLWVETLDPELPFTFLDHKIKVGNSLVGCWLDRVLDYPLKAWEREGGDGKNGPRTDHIEAYLKGPKVDGRRSGDGIIKKEMRQLIESRFQQVASLFPDTSATAGDVVAAARIEYELLHEASLLDPDQRERLYRDRIENSKPLRLLKRAMDEWCAVWFWPTDEESLKHVPTPLTFHQSIPERDKIVEALCHELRFFHWEVAFPDVFTPTRSGFDALVGNPPWDVMKPNSQEFFTEFDPLYRTYDKQAALRKQQELFTRISTLSTQWGEYIARFKGLGNWARNAADPFDVALARGKDEVSLKTAWEKHRRGHVGFTDARHPYRLQGSADLNLYKLFAEVFWMLLQADGRLGVILPTGIYSDFGTRDLREELLFRGRVDFIYAFQNEKKIFVAADHRFKQIALFATKGGSTQTFRTMFRMGVGDSPHSQEIPTDIMLPNNRAMVFTLDDVRANSPKTLSLVELRSQRDFDIFRTIYLHSVRIGDNTPGWEITYAREFDMTNDSMHFPPLEKWESKGYKPDVFGRWIGPESDVALPLYEGRMVGQFDCSQKGWVSGKGRKAVWREISFEQKCIEPQFLMPAKTFESSVKAFSGPKLALMDITSSTNTRTTITVATRGLPYGHSAPVLSVKNAELLKTLFLSSVLNSLTFDFAARPRVSGVHMTWFILEECPIPMVAVDSPVFLAAATRAAQLTFVHRRYAPEWLRLRSLLPELAKKEWKHRWSVTEADRLRMRVEIDALCAELCGLTPDDFDWVVRDDPTDPKGFYRLDREYPLRERLTSLAAAAFRALKSGKWCAASAAKLSNDEFFEILGIPELTN
ncbi:MAG: hypothetical protein WCI73_14600, partial [Phycisphaerae bacterium]